MNFEEALAYMQGLLRFGWKLGNERFEALCARLGDPQDRFSVIHIAGTKGKGSTTAIASAILYASGYVVGGYFSPYVYDPCERVQIDGVMIPRADFARLVTLIRPHMEELAQTELGQTTEFEIKTALGFLYFAERKVDWACIEVGLGGRLDATNVVKPAVAVITNIGLDHVAQLGDTHALIAGEKAGIIKCNVPCFTATEHPDAIDVITRVAESHEAPLAFIRRGNSLRPTNDAARVRWESAGHTAPVSIATETAVYPQMPMRLDGLYQRANAACAVAAVERALADQGLKLTEEAVRTGLANVALPGRLEKIRLSDGPLVVLDGAHNEMAAGVLADAVRTLRVEQNVRRMFLVIGMMTGHAPEGVLAQFASEADRIYVCEPDWKRAQPAEELAEIARQFNPHVEVVRSVPDALASAISAASAEDLVLVTGSFYVVGEAGSNLSCNGL